MDRQKEQLKLCKPLIIQLTRLSKSDINKWTQKRKHIERPYQRYRSYMWLRRNRRHLVPQTVRKLRKRPIKYVLSSDSDDKSSESKSLSDSDNDVSSNKSNAKSNESDITEYKTAVVDDTSDDSDVNSDDDGEDDEDDDDDNDNVATISLKTHRTSNGKVAWKFKRKRKRISHSLDKIEQQIESIDEASMTSPLANSNVSSSHETVQIDLSKEIKIVSSRLEDSDDPQIKRWRSKKKSSSLPKIKQRLTPKTISLDCTMCSVVFDTKEQLSDHIFKHTQRELQDAYNAAMTQIHENNINVDVGSNNSNKMIDKIACIDEPSSICDQLATIKSTTTKEIVEATPTTALSTNTQVALPKSLVICSCHCDRHPQSEASVQIEMVLFCDICRVLFRRSECFETHYRFSSICSTDRTKGRTPKLFCSSCQVILNTLSSMRRHLEDHASVNFHGTVTFVCYICRVVFFGVGTVFCTHWFNHEKDATFVASRYSFPKLCVSTQGIKPLGSAPGEQYLFVAEYVCRICKSQFSSESELTVHIEKDCKNLTAIIPTAVTTTNSTTTTTSSSSSSSSIISTAAIAITTITSPTPTVTTQVQNKSPNLKSIVPNSKSLKSTPDVNRVRIGLIPLNPLDIIDKWICEFCGECYPTRYAFEEHSVRHLQDDGYPGYSCAFQLTSSTTFICNVCRSVHNTLQDLMKHWVTHDVIKFICTACNEECSSYNSLEAHISLACWKLQPACRVRFNRQYKSCKICQFTFKTAEELAHHYTYDHGSEANSEIKMLTSKSVAIVETPPASEASPSPQFNDNNLNKIIIPISSGPIDNQSTSINLNINNSTVNINGESDSLNIDNSFSKNCPLGQLSTIKITIPNPIDQSVVTPCQDHSVINSIALNDNIETEMSSKYCELPSAPTTVQLSTATDINVPGSSIIVNATNNIDVITTNAVKLNNNTDNNTTLTKINIGHIQLPLSLGTASVNITSPAKLNSLNNVSITNDILKLSDANDVLQIITKSGVDGNVEEITDKVMENSDNDESDIIEIPHNISIKKNTILQNSDINIVQKPKSIILEGSESESDKSNSINIETIRNSDSIYTNVIESNDHLSESSMNSDVTKPKGFLRVKKFTELQAVKNHICNQCAAAFDNLKSLNEHMVAHNRQLAGIKTHPTMIAALVLPQDNNTNQLQNITPVILPNAPQMAGKRILPNIPQRAVNANGRRACPLVRAQSINKTQNLPPVQNISNTSNAPVDNRCYYTCPICLVFHCEKSEDFTNHLSTNHANINFSIANSNINNSNNINPAINETSSDKQKVYTCKVCKYSTLHREMIVNHIRYYHLNHINPTSNVESNNIPKSIQHIDLTESTNDNANINNLPRYRCSLCTIYQYNTLEELSQHLQMVHQAVIQKDIYHPYVCNICFCVFKTYNELLIHSNSHQSIGWT